MTRRNSSWLGLSMSAMQLGLEAQGVIALRMMKMAAGGAAAEAEVQRMVSEKTKAALDAQLQFGISVMSGRLDLAPTGGGSAPAASGGQGRLEPPRRGLRLTPGRRSEMKRFRALLREAV
jgi:hypothetical protein